MADFGGGLTEDDIHAEIAAQLPLQSGVEIRAANRELAEKAADYAKSIAPVNTGAYRDSIHVQNRSEVDGMPATQVIADIDYANLVEYGTIHVPPNPVFGQTAAAFGGDQLEKIDDHRNPRV